MKHHFSTIFVRGTPLFWSILSFWYFMESRLRTTNLVKLNPRSPHRFGPSAAMHSSSLLSGETVGLPCQNMEIRSLKWTRGAIWFPAFSLYIQVWVCQTAYWISEIKEFFQTISKGLDIAHWTWGLKCLFLKLNEQNQKRKVCWTQWDWCEKWPVPCCNELLKNFPGTCLPTWPGEEGRSLFLGIRLA